MTDDALIARMNQATSLEWERQQKLNKNSQGPKVRGIKAETQLVTEATVGAVGGQVQSSPLSTKVKAVKTQPVVMRTEADLLDIIRQLKEEVQRIKKVMYESPKLSARQHVSRKHGCRNCQDSDKGEQWSLLQVWAKWSLIQGL